MVAGLVELSALLPLPERRAALAPEVATVHRAVLDSFVTTGRPGSHDPAAVAALADEDLVVVGSDGSISGAYPFTLTETDHTVTVGGVMVHAMCSLDAIAVSPAFDVEATVGSRCAVTDVSVEIRMAGSDVVASPDSVHIGIRWQAVQSCAASSLCRDMVFLSDRTTAERWRGPDPASAGIFDLGEAIGLAVAFFGPIVHGPGRLRYPE